MDRCKTDGTSAVKKAIFASAAFVAGAVNGLLGAGGGVVMLYLIRYYLGGGETAERDSYADVVLVMLPVSLVSSISYAARGNIDFSKMAVLAIPALVGGGIGAYLVRRLPTFVIRAIFAVLVIFSGARMLFGGAI